MSSWNVPEGFSVLGDRLMLRPVAQWLTTRLEAEHCLGRADNIHRLSRLADPKALRFWVFGRGDPDIGARMLSRLDDAAIRPLAGDLLRHWGSLPDAVSGACAPALARLYPEAFAIVAFNQARRGALAGNAARTLGLVRSLSELRNHHVLILETLLTRARDSRDTTTLIWSGLFHTAAATGSVGLVDVLVDVLKALSDADATWAETLLSDVFSAHAGDSPMFALASDRLAQRRTVRFSDLSRLMAPDAPVEAMERYLSSPQTQRTESILEWLPPRAPLPGLALLCRQMVLTLPSTLPTETQKILRAFYVASLAVQYVLPRVGFGGWSLPDLLELCTLDLPSLPGGEGLEDALTARATWRHEGALIKALRLHQAGNGGRRLVRVMESIGANHYVDALVGCLDDPCDDDVREDALRALARMGRTGVQSMLSRARRNIDGLSLPHAIRLCELVGGDAGAEGLAGLWPLAGGAPGVRTLWKECAARMASHLMTGTLASALRRDDPDRERLLGHHGQLMGGLSGEPGSSRAWAA